MPRKGPAPRRELMPDPIYRSVVVTQLVNKILMRGKRSLSERIVYDAMNIIEEKTGAEPIAARPGRPHRAIEAAVLPQPGVALRLPLAHRRHADDPPGPGPAAG